MPSNAPGIAYFLMIHKEPDQFQRLLSVIWDPNNFYAIHVDLTAPVASHKAAHDIAGGRSNIHVLKSINCRHGGFSLVRAQQLGLRSLLDISTRWSFFINLSGEDFPLKRQSEISRDLANTPNHNFLNVFDPWEECIWNDVDERYDGVYWEPRSEKRAYRLGRVKVSRRWLLGGARIYGGSQWMILSRDFCEYAARFPNTWRAQLFFRNTYVPDESFYQTVLMNSPFQATLINDNRRFIDWKTGPERPRVLRLSDLSRLSNSSALFARKVNIRTDNSLIEKLEELTRE